MISSPQARHILSSLRHHAESGLMYVTAAALHDHDIQPYQLLGLPFYHGMGEATDEFGCRRDVHLIDKAELERFASKSWTERMGFEPTNGRRSR